MPDVDNMPVVLAAMGAIVLAVFWYSALFGKQWEELTGLSAESFKSANPAVIFGGAFLLNLLAAYLLSLFIGRAPDTGFAAGAGLAVGLCCVTASLGVNYLFERRPLGLWLINGAYFTLQFTLMGAILGATG